MQKVPYQYLFTFPTAADGHGLSQAADATHPGIFPIPTGMCAVLTDLYAENLDDVNESLSISVDPLGPDRAHFGFNILAKQRLFLNFSTGLPLGGAAAGLSEIRVGNASASRVTLGIRYRINGYFVDAPIRVSIDSPAPPVNGLPSRVPETFQVVGRSLGNTLLAPSSSAVIYSPLTNSPVKNGIGVVTTPPAGSDWAFQFTDVSEPPRPGEFSILVVRLVDADGRTGHAEQLLAVVR